jgi:hypothetical protein
MLAIMPALRIDRAARPPGLLAVTAGEIPAKYPI